MDVKAITGRNQSVRVASSIFTNPINILALKLPGIQLV